MPIKSIVFYLLLATSFFAEGTAPHVHPTDGAHQDSFDLSEPATFGNFFSRLLRQDFMPHGHCYFWRSEIVWLHVISDLLITLAYYSIPLILLVFIRRRKDLPFKWMIGLFGGFILFCGTTHLMGIITLWNPVYRLDGLIKAMTAGISVFTAVLLVPIIPKALALRSPRELEEANAKLNSEIVERKRAEFELADRARELYEANEKLREIDRLKDNFFSNVSHELRTPLTLIIAPLESLLGNDYGAFSEQQRRQLEAMHNNSIRLYQMVNGILDFAKIGAGKIQPKPEPTDIISLTGSIISEFQPVFKRKYLVSTFTHTLTRSIVQIDRYLYERILFNLLANAVKFTPDAGTITVSLEHQNGVLTLKVKDTGIGIAQGDQARLFQRFTQVDSSSTRRFEGTGLGLALVKEFSTLLEGDVRVDSELGKGSQFTVELKASLTDESVAHGAEKLAGRFQTFDVLPVIEPIAAIPIDKNIGRPKVLIAEDNVELSSYISTLLSGMSQVRVAGTGKAATELIETWQPDLVLADVMMPEKDGLTLCREIKADPKTSHIPVVILTALTHRDALLRGWEVGADEYLFKPFHPKELLTRIRMLLTISRDRQLLIKQTAELEALKQEQAFSSMIAHDLRAPLRGITAYSQILLNDYAKNLDETGQRYLSWVEDSGKRMDRLIDGLLKFFRLSEAELLREQVDLGEMAKLVIADLTAASPGRQIEFHTRTKMLVQADRQLLRVVLENLLGNAFKFTAKHSHAKIELGVVDKNGQEVYFIRDDGAGFDMKYANKLFGVFRRLHGDDEFPGTGIGLVSVHRIISRHGGKIWAEGEVEKGATFYFTL